EAISCQQLLLKFLFFRGQPSTDMCTLSLHDALPISDARSAIKAGCGRFKWNVTVSPLVLTDSRLRYQALRGLARSFSVPLSRTRDRKSTRLNSSHVSISYAVFCLKKKNHL